MARKQFRDERTAGDKPKRSGKVWVAAYSGRCAAGDDIEVGDECQYVDDEPMHVTCQRAAVRQQKEKVCQNANCLYFNMIHTGLCV